MTWSVYPQSKRKACRKAGLSGQFEGVQLRSCLTYSQSPIPSHLQHLSLLQMPLQPVRQIPPRPVPHFNLKSSVHKKKGGIHSDSSLNMPCFRDAGLITDQSRILTTLPEPTVLPPSRRIRDAKYMYSCILHPLCTCILVFILISCLFRQKM